MSEQVLPPNFDDERTLQTARPVVSLKEIEAKVRRRRRWFLAGAFAVAMMFGAASALVGARLAQRNVPAATTSEMVEEDIAPVPLAVVENTPSPEPTESPVTEPVVKRRAVVKHTEEPIALRDDPPDDPKVSEGERLQQIRDAVLYDQWQEQRARRVMRRDRRLDNYNHRDLSNLDEIFEGRRRKKP